MQLRRGGMSAAMAQTFRLLSAKSYHPGEASPLCRLLVPQPGGRATH